jgi:type IV secretion system protein VirB10
VILEAPTRRKAAGPLPDDPRPVVALPNAGLPGIAIAIFAAICAVLLFFTLEAQRQRSDPEADALDRTHGDTLAPPPPLFVPPEPVPAPPPMVTLTVGPQAAPAPEPRVRAQSPAPYPVVEPFPAVPPMPWPTPPPTFMPEATPQVQADLTAPALIFDAGGVAGDAAESTPAPPAGANPETDENREGPSTPPRAASLTRIRNSATVVPTGTIIRATLETPIDTSRPGFARALVSRDAQGFDGRRVLIPRGSRLIGEYGADIRTGQNRVLINWTQLLRPDGSMIRLDSPAADALGGAGVPGRVNSFFFERFFNAILQTAITVGGNYAAYSSNAPVIIGLPTSAVSNAVGQSPLLGQVPQPKIKVKRGTAFSIFVARDLDFSGAPFRSQAGADGR